MDVRVLVNMSEDHIWKYEDGNYTVLFEDDQRITMTGRQIILSWYYWEIYRKFPLTPIISSTAISDNYTAKTHCDLGGKLIYHTYSHMRSHTKSEWLLWRISEVFIYVTNSVYNMTCNRLGAYVTGGSLHDIIELLEEPTLVVAKDNYLQTVEENEYNEVIVTQEINKVYKVVKDILFNNREHLKHNAIKKLCQAGIGNPDQLVQMVAPRGYLTEINGKIFPLPINTGYAEGLLTMYDSAIESRSASNAKLMVTVPLQETEYHNRKIRLSVSVITKYTIDCCTNFELLDYLVEEGDLTLLKGKYHMVQNQPVLIWDTIDHLVGTCIQLRTITGCGCKNTQHVCKICLGAIHEIIPPRANLGHRLVVPLLGILAQNMLSVKHLDRSAISRTVTLTGIGLKWLETNSKMPNAIFLTEEAVKQDLVIRIASPYIRHLNQIMHTDINNLPVSRVSKIPELGFNYLINGSCEGTFDKVVLTNNSDGIHLSSDLLVYLKANGWNSENGYIDIVLSKNKRIFLKKPIFTISRSSDNMMTFFNEVKTFTEPRKKTCSHILKYNTRSRAVQEFIVILRKRLNAETKQEFNITAVEAIVRSLMIKSFRDEDYNLPHSTESFEFTKLNNVLRNRSLSTMFAHQFQSKAILETHWTEPNKKVEAILDSLLIVS